MVRALRAGLRNGGLRRGGLRPGLGGGSLFAIASLDLNFAAYKNLDSRVTFTRASSGTFVGSDGTIKTASTDVLRFDHNPTTGESLGLLVEEARTNLVLRSEEFNDASWAKVGSTVTANTSTAPDGATTADLLTRTTTGVSYATQTFTKAASAIQYIFTVFAKQSVGNFCALRVQGTYPSRVDVVFNLSSATVSTAATVFGSFTGPSASITPYANGWYRLTVTGTSDAVVALQVLTSFNSNGTVADGTDSVSNSAGLLWGAQLEAGAFPTSYIPTTTATVTRAADVPSIAGANFSSWYNQTEGTMFADVTARPDGLILVVDDGGFANRKPQMSIGVGSAADSAYVTGGSSVASFTQASTSNQRNLIATAYATDNYGFAANGGTPQQDSAGVLPISVNTLRIGRFHTGSVPLYGTIKRLTYWPVRLSNTTLQQITQP